MDSDLFAVLGAAAAVKKTFKFAIGLLQFQTICSRRSIPDQQSHSREDLHEK
jgi:hypothetical protein